jgi:hypothetical protein
MRCTIGHGSLCQLLANACIRAVLPHIHASASGLAGPGGYTAMDIPHNTTWEIK